MHCIDSVSVYFKAPGEAEAELAYLNRIKVIDAVMTDDVDALLFGAQIVIRKYVRIHKAPVQPHLTYFHSSGAKLTGNQKSPAQDAQGKTSEHHVRLFVADRIESDHNVQMTRGGMILFALLAGGDYDNGKVRATRFLQCKVMIIVL